MKKRNQKKWRLPIWQAAFMAAIFLYFGSYRVNAAQEDDVLPTETEEETDMKTEEETGGETSKTEGAVSMGDIIPGVSLIKRISLNDSTVTQIPRYITEDGIFYALNENAITIEEAGYGSSEGADVVTTKRKVENLPDNDLERIEKTIIYEGITCKLLCITYEIAGRDERGIPDSYSAVCEYGGLKKYSNSYATDWVAIVRYDAYERITLPLEQVSVEVSEEGYGNGAGYGHENDNLSQKNTQESSEGSGVQENEEEEKTPDFPENKLMTVKMPHQDENWDIWKYLLLLLAIFLALLLLFALIYGICALMSRTAFLFSLTRKGKYRFIGCLRLQEKEGNCIVHLPERVIERAEILSFKMKIPEKAVKRIGMGMLVVQCPDGKAIALILGKEVAFSLEKS